jgi:hypothetical protein
VVCYRENFTALPKVKPDEGPEIELQAITLTSFRITDSLRNQRYKV